MDKRNILKLFSLICALVMIVTSFSACGNDGGNDGGESVNENDTVKEKDDASGEQLKHIPVEERTEVYMPVKVTTTGTGAGVIDLAYDENGNIMKIVETKENVSDTRGNSVREYAFDEFNNCTLVYIEWGKGDTSEEKYTYTYDSDGNMLSKTDETGDVYSYTYDVNGNLLTTNADDSYIITNVYDNNENVLIKKKEYLRDSSFELWEHTYDNKGNKISTKYTDEDGKVTETTYKYDVAGNLIEENNTSMGRKTYEYDKNGNLTGDVWYMGDETIDTSYTYNEKNELIKKSGSISLGGGQTYESNYTYEYKDNQRIVTEHYTESDGDEQTTVIVGVLTKYPNGISDKTVSVLEGLYILDDYGRN